MRTWKLELSYCSFPILEVSADHSFLIMLAHQDTYSLETLA